MYDILAVVPPRSDHGISPRVSFYDDAEAAVLSVLFFRPHFWTSEGVQYEEGKGCAVEGGAPSNDLSISADERQREAK
jgi:hypothetical protein